MRKVFITAHKRSLRRLCFYMSHVCPQGGAWSGGGLLPGGCLVQGVPAPRGSATGAGSAPIGSCTRGLVPALEGGGGVETPHPPMECYWNAFFFTLLFFFTSTEFLNPLLTEVIEFFRIEF